MSVGVTDCFKLRSLYTSTFCKKYEVDIQFTCLSFHLDSDSVSWSFFYRQFEDLLRSLPGSCQVQQDRQSIAAHYYQKNLLQLDELILEVIEIVDLTQESLGECHLLFVDPAQSCWIDQ